MRLDITVLRYLTRDDWRILMAVELGMKNHDLVPVDLLVKIGRLHRGGTFKAISNLHKHKLIFHENKIYDGYRLTYLGYDFLCLNAMSMRGRVESVGTKIGVGKESDIYACAGPNDEPYVLKLARLGRISFRNIKNKRDYLLKRKAASWLYMSRLAAFREFSYMQVLHEHGLPIPRPVDWSRHGVLMERVDGFNLSTVHECDDPNELYRSLMAIILRFASFGLIHCDFNEFNLMVSDEGKITVIDFPQMVSIDHENAQWYFERDVECIVTFFAKRFRYECDYKAEWDEVQPGPVRLDQLVKASGVNSSVGMDKHEIQSQVVPEERPMVAEDEEVQLDDPDALVEKSNDAASVEKREGEPDDPEISLDEEEEDDEGGEEEQRDDVNDEQDNDKKRGGEKEGGKKGLGKKPAGKAKAAAIAASSQEAVRANVRREMRKKGQEKQLKSAKRQGKREKQRDGQRKVKDSMGGGDSGGW